MQRIRITIPHTPVDPTDDLRCAADVRRDLWAHSPVEIDPDSGTERVETRSKTRTSSLPPIICPKSFELCRSSDTVIV
jgi:hypothetical protein